MQVLFLSHCLLLAVVLKHLGIATGQFMAAPPTCPGDTFTFRCNVTGNMDGVTIWRVGASSNLCPLLHMSTSTAICVPSGTSNDFTAEPGSNFGTSATSFSSTLSGIATSTLDGRLVECFGPANSVDTGNRVGHSNIHVLGPPTISTLSCVELSEDVSGAVNITVSWTLSGGDSADFFLINITTNAPQTPYGGLLNITTGSVTQYELTGFMTGYEYNITIRGVNCGSLVGRESEPLTIIPQVPTVLSNCNINLSYNQVSKKLLFINSIWNSMPDPVGPEVACKGPRGNVTQYQISFQTLNMNFTENVTVAVCTTGSCSHTYEPASNLLNSNVPSSYHSILVAAENMVGVGTARNCTTQHSISTTNNLLTGEIVGVSSPIDARLNCTFLSGFTGSARCIVQYGTDPTFMNLPYSAESTENGTAGDSVSVVLRERLNSSTVYYYTVSAVSGDVTVTVRWSFTTPQYTCFLEEFWNLPAAGVTFLPDVSLLDDAAQYRSCGDGSVGSAVLVNTTLNTTTVAYYTGTTPGSSACFVCDDSSRYELNTTTNERVCRSNGTWSGSPIMCIPTVVMVLNPTVNSPMELLTVSAAVGVTVACIALVIFIIAGVVATVLMYHCISKHRFQNCKPEPSSFHHQQQAVLSSNALQQTDPEYEEVVELKQNKAYELTQIGIEMRTN